MKTQVSLFMLLLAAGSSALAWGRSPSALTTVLPDKKIVCKFEPTGPVQAWFVLSAAQPVQSNEPTAILQAQSVTYQFLGEEITSGTAKIVSAEQYRPLSLTPFASTTLQFDLNASGAREPYLKIIATDVNIRDDRYFRVDTNLNVVSKYAFAPTRVYDRSRMAKSFEYCEQTNEGL